MTNPASPSIASTADFKELLDAWEDAHSAYADWNRARDNHDASYDFTRLRASRKAVEDYVARISARNVVEDSVYAVGRCDQCEEPIEIWRTLGGYLKAYDRDAGDPVPHDCRRVSELRAELAPLRDSQ